MNQQQNQGQEIDGQQFRCGARLRFGPSRKDQSEMEQQAGHQQTRHDFGPINLPVESVQFSAEVERPKAERSQAKNVEVHGPGSIPPADENEQADEQVKQADNAKVIFNGEEFETPLVTAPAVKPLAIENYLRVVGLFYLFIGLFIFVRRWNAPRAVHFYIFCLASFSLWSFHFSGKLDAFDWEIYWSEVVARLLVPGLLLHFALVFPGRTESKARATAKLLAVYLLPLVLLLVHVCTALAALGFVPWLGAYLLLDKF